MPVEPLASSNFGSLAKRISTVTTNSLLTLLVLVAGLGVGRHVLRWWAVDTSPNPSAVSLGNIAQFHTLQFGDNSCSLHRCSITGDRITAAEQLRKACREVLVAGSLGKTLAASENDNLSFLAGYIPVDADPGKWRLYELERTFPMMVGVAVKANRVQGNALVWGMAMPIGERQWMLNTFQPAVSSTGERFDLSNAPLPPGGHKTLALSAVDGGIMAFHGSAQPAEWRRFYEDCLVHRGWRQVTSWQSTENAWYARFSAFNDLIDVRFGPDGKGGLSGVVVTQHESR